MPAPSARDLYDAGRTQMLVRRPSLIVSPGDITDQHLWASTAMAEIVLVRGAKQVGDTFLDDSDGAALTKVAHDRYDVDRFEAAAAIGTVTLARSGAAAGSLLAGTRVATDPDADGAFQVYTLDEDLVFTALDASLTAAATAEASGKDGNAEPAAITRVLDQPAFDSTFTVTNEDRFVGGAPQESDEELRSRCRGINQTRPRGTGDALETGALQVPAVRVVSVEESGPVVSVYVSDGDGNSNAAMVAAVEVELESWRAKGVILVVLGGTRFEQSITVSLTVRTGVSIPALALRVRQAIVAAVNRLASGETLTRGLIEAAARSVDSEGITDVEVDIPAASVAPAASEVIRTSLDLVSVG